MQITYNFEDPATKQGTIREFVVELFKMYKEKKIAPNAITLNITLLELTLLNFPSTANIEKRLKDLTIDLLEFKGIQGTKYNVFTNILESITLDTEKGIINVTTTTNSESIELTLLH